MNEREQEAPGSAPRTVDYLTVAKANWDAIPGFTHDPMQRVAAMQACALVSIAESLAVIAADLTASPDISEPIWVNAPPCVRLIDWLAGEFRPEADA